MQEGPETAPPSLTEARKLMRKLRITTPVAAYSAISCNKASQLEEDGPSDSLGE